MRAALASGTPVLLVAAHQCNWEWMLLALSLELGYPLEAAYKPLVDGWAQREMLKARSRFGAQLVPAQDLLGAHPARRTHAARDRDGRRPGAAHQRAAALDALHEPGHGVLHGRRGNHPGHQVSGLLHRSAPHAPRPLRGVRHAAVAARRETCDRRTHRALCAAGGDADPAPRLRTGRGPTNAGSSRSRCTRGDPDDDAIGSPLGRAAAGAAVRTGLLDRFAMEAGTPRRQPAARGGR